MPNKQYKKGTNFEYKVKKYYEKQGAFVFRSAGSHSPLDLLIFYPGGTIMGIQCKIKGNLLKYEEEELQELKYKYSIPILIASKDKKQIALRTI